MIDLGDGSGFEGNWQTFRKSGTVQAIQMPFPFRVKTLHGVAEGKAGDWLARGDGDCWPIDAKIFASVYTPADAPQAEKDACGCGGSCGCKDEGVIDMTVDELLDYLFGGEEFTKSEQETFIRTGYYVPSTKTLYVGSDTSVTVDQIFNALVGSEDS